ncbi:MAG: type II secretion system ATPase GspE [Rhodospirillales bacterium]|nr:type II secretion system ATPase GspE [Rhodospirillales bacterium]
MPDPTDGNGNVAIVDNTDGVLGDAAAVDAAVVDWLTGRGKLDAAGVQRAKRIQPDGGEHLYSLLIKLGLASEGDVAAALSAVLGLPLITAADFPSQALLDGALSAKFLKDSRIVPVAESETGVVLAMADPLDDFAAGSIEAATGRPVVRRIAVSADIEKALERLYGRAGSVLGEIDQLGEHGEHGGDDAERLKDMASEAPVIRFVNQLIGRAVEARASDIHIEPFENKLRVRYRVDGILQEVETPPGRLAAAIISRVKIMSKLNIAERRLPQDGRIKLAIRGKEVDFRISTVPTLHGESVVMRILDRGGAVFEFAALGLDAGVLDPYLQLLDRPNGIVLVTGPTGSGKTTTLYTSLLRLNTPDCKILTVEDPIEYQLEGVNQVQVKAQIGLTFAGVLRALLRQDPDIIMIGEIRDLETAQIAAQAALTGHLVLSTLHTNSAAGSVTRLLDMGLEDYLLASTLNGIAAQRLVRNLCPHCREPNPAAGEIATQMNLLRFAEGGVLRIDRPVGCPRCNGTGYYGRSCIAEMLVMTDEIRRIILRREDAGAIQRAAIEGGMRTLYEDGMRKVVRGVTSLEEVLRVTREA